MTYNNALILGPLGGGERKLTLQEMLPFVGHVFEQPTVAKSLDKVPKI